LKKCNSQGNDQIPAEIIQAGDEILPSAIHSLINSVWNMVELPNQSKEFILVPVHNNGYKTACNNYRGISMLSTSYNFFFNILLSRLSPYIDEIIGDHWCEFLHNRSTADMLSCIYQILEKKQEYNETVHQ
jgi:hypothetical protein